MSNSFKHRQEKQNQMSNILRSVDALITAHFPADHIARLEGERQLHQLWALLFLGYNSAEPQENAQAPKPESPGTEKKEEPATPGDAASTESLPEPLAQTKLESVK